MKIEVEPFIPLSLNRREGFEHAEITITDPPADGSWRFNPGKIIADHLKVDQARITDLEWTPARETDSSIYRVYVEYKIKPESKV